MKHYLVSSLRLEPEEALKYLEMGRTKYPGRYWTSIRRDKLLSQGRSIRDTY